MADREKNKTGTFGPNADSKRTRSGELLRKKSSGVKRWQTAYPDRPSGSGKQAGKKPEQAAPAGEEGRKPTGPLCPYMKKCGGCAFIGEDYGETLKQKEAYVRRLLAPYVRLTGIVGMEEPYHYRNKIHRVVSYETEGRHEFHTAGIYAEGTHKVVPVRRCLIEDRQADAIIADVLELAKAFKIRSYNEDTESGLLRHILIRTAHTTGQIMLVLVLTSPVLPGKTHFIKALVEKHPEITTVVININHKKTTMVLGEREQTVYGKGYIEDILCGKKFRISSKSFYQINSLQTERLYAQAIEYAHLTGHETVVDAYCGIGTIGIAAADRAKIVYGVELSGDAVRDAAANAKLNGVNRIRFFENDAGDFLEKMAEERQKADVIFLDPPRSGSTEEFLASAVSVSPGRIIYISCGPESLARDLKWLTKHGYKAREAMAFDMFPWTEIRHTETVVLLTKQSVQKRA